jgi:hypothetical protein
MKGKQLLMCSFVLGTPAISMILVNVLIACQCKWDAPSYFSGALVVCETATVCSYNQETGEFDVWPDHDPCPEGTHCIMDYYFVPAHALCADTDDPTTCDPDGQDPVEKVVKFPVTVSCKSKVFGGWECGPLSTTVSNVDNASGVDCTWN